MRGKLTWKRTTDPNKKGNQAANTAYVPNEIVQKASAIGDIGNVSHPAIYLLYIKGIFLVLQRTIEGPIKPIQKPKD